MKIDIPADVPKEKKETYRSNFFSITQNTERLMLFSCDQKIEHLNQDFYGKNIPMQANTPEYLFAIASQGRIGAMATHLGLIAQYGKHYPSINYIAKLNGKTNLIPLEQMDPKSAPLWDVHQALELKEQAGLNICGIGLTIYIGSEYESEMLTLAAQEIYEAHQHGLISILWVYPRGKAVPDDQDPELIAGAAGIAASLGSDFVKVKPPRAQTSQKSAEYLAIASAAAGNTKIICSGGRTVDPQLFLEQLYDQIHIGGAAGSATGRNIFQRQLPQAIGMANAISALVYDNVDVKEALQLI